MYINHMYSTFADVLQMSITASIVIIVLILLRPVIKKFPRIFSYLLWGIVLFRLICPVSFQSSVSILEVSDSFFHKIFFQKEDVYGEVRAEDKFESEDYVILEETVILQVEDEQHMLQRSMVPQSRDYTPTEVTKLPLWKLLISIIWIIGIGAMSGYGVGSYLSLKKELRGAAKQEDGVFVCDYIQTGFVLGIFFPRIYLPSDLEPSKRKFILLHEQIHIKRGDSVFRLLAYIALVIHWFNPLVWIAFHMSGTDMELSCDEAVIRKMGGEVRKEYAAALLELAVGKHLFFSGFPAFGENQTKERINSVVKYKEKSIFVIIIGVIIFAVLVMVLASNPRSKEKEDFTVSMKEEENPGAKEAFIRTKIEEWATAFCNRDGNTIINMSTSEARKVFEEEFLLVEGAESASFGWSSPWPVEETDYKVKLLEEDRAIVLYYARTSDPHITVWAEILEFQSGDNWEEAEDFRITNSRIMYLSSIENSVSYTMAYEDGIKNTPIDYLTNGLGEVLNKNAMENRDSNWYSMLFAPETAIISLLNLNPQEISMNIYEGEEEVIITFCFLGSEDSGILQSIKMVQPFGKEGIWIPQDYTDKVSMIQPENYFNHYEFYKEELGENFLEEYYQQVYSVESDISRDGIKETIEVYKGNVGDGDSGYVMVKDIHGNLLFHEFAHAARAGWNTVFLSDQDFLMNVHIDDRETYGEYSYEVYRVLGKDEIQILAKDSFSFDKDRGMYDEQKIIEFMNTLSGYASKSSLLLSTQEGEIKALGVSEEIPMLEDIMEDFYLWKKLISSTKLELQSPSK